MVDYEGYLGGEMLPLCDQHISFPSIWPARIWPLGTIRRKLIPCVTEPQLNQNHGGDGHKKRKKAQKKGASVFVPSCAFCGQSVWANSPRRNTKLEPCHPEATQLLLCVLRVLWVENLYSIRPSSNSIKSGTLLISSTRAAQPIAASAFAMNSRPASVMPICT